jgi:hypothetical protein
LILDNRIQYWSIDKTDQSIYLFQWKDILERRWTLAASSKAKKSWIPCYYMKPLKIELCLLFSNLSWFQNDSIFFYKEYTKMSLYQEFPKESSVLLPTFTINWSFWSHSQILLWNRPLWEQRSGPYLIC